MGKINYNKAFALPNEIWEDVRGYEGLYKVSSMGRVKSLEKIDSRGQLRKEKILRSDINHGYLRVTLYKDKKAKHYRIHRLVAQAFLKPVPGKDFINHLNEIKTDNHYSNLEYCTPKENTNYGTGIQRSVEKNKNGKRSKIVYQYNLDGELIKEWPSMMEIRRKMRYSHISDCCLGKRKTAYGYIWRYK